MIDFLHLATNLLRIAKESAFQSARGLSQGEEIKIEATFSLAVSSTLSTNSISKKLCSQNIMFYKHNNFLAKNVKITMGTNLKKYIEDLLIRESEDMEDAEVYKYLIATRHEGKVMLNAVEKKDFESWLNDK